MANIDGKWRGGKKDFAHKLVYTINSTNETAKGSTVQNICKVRISGIPLRKRVNFILRLNIYQVQQCIYQSLLKLRFLRPWTGLTVVGESLYVIIPVFML